MKIERTITIADSNYSWVADKTNIFSNPSSIADGIEEAIDHMLSQRCVIDPNHIYTWDDDALKPDFKNSILFKIYPVIENIIEEGVENAYEKLRVYKITGEINDNILKTIFTNSILDELEQYIIENK